MVDARKVVHLRCVWTTQQQDDDNRSVLFIVFKVDV